MKELKFICVQMLSIASMTIIHYYLRSYPGNNSTVWHYEKKDTKFRKINGKIDLYI